MTRRQLLRTITVGTVGGMAGCVGDWTDRPPERPSSTDPGDNWPMFQFDPASTSHNPNATGPKHPVEMRWVFHSGSLETSPTIADGVVYIATADTLFAISTVNGGEYWRSSGRGRFRTPAVDNATVYLAANNAARSGGGDIYARSVTDGAEKWHVRTKAGLSRPVVWEDTVYVVDETGRLFAFAAADGTEQWRIDIMGNDIGLGLYRLAGPTVTDDTLYVVGRTAQSNASTYNDALYAVDIADGTERWQFIPARGTLSPPCVVEGTVYVVNTGGYSGAHVQALATVDGTERWRFSIPELNTSFQRAAPAVADGTVYVKNIANRWGEVPGGQPLDTNYVYALAATDGTERWRFELGTTLGLESPAPPRNPPVVVDGSDTIYLGGMTVLSTRSLRLMALSGGTFLSTAMSPPRQQWSTERSLCRS